MAKEVQYIIVKGVRRKEPDLRKFARALIQLTLAQQDAEDVDRLDLSEGDGGSA